MHNLIVAFLQHPAAIRSGLIEAKIDALNRSITVTRTSKAPFSLEQWKDLRDRLQEWKDNIGGVKTVLEEVNVKMRAQQQEEAQVSAGHSCACMPGSKPMSQEMGVIKNPNSKIPFLVPLYPQQKKSRGARSGPGR